MKPNRVAAAAAALAFSAVAAFALVQGRQADSTRGLDDSSRRWGSIPATSSVTSGPGTASGAVALAAHVGSEGKIYATEVAKLDRLRSRIEREKLDNVEVIVGTQTDTGLPPTCCDAVLLRRVYHHLEDPAAMHRSLLRSLKPEGLVFVVEFATKKGWRRPDGIPESREGHGIDESLLVREMQEGGFDVVDRMEWTSGDYAVLFRRAAID